MGVEIADQGGLARFGCQIGQIHGGGRLADATLVAVESQRCHESEDPVLSVEKLAKQFTVGGGGKLRKGLGKPRLQLLLPAGELFDQEANRHQSHFALGIAGGENFGEMQQVGLLDRQVVEYAEIIL